MDFPSLAEFVHTAWLYTLLAFISAFVIVKTFQPFISLYFEALWESKGIPGARRVLLVTAHPDDECMFFGPSLVALAKTHNVRVYLLCLSTGDHDGLGQTRHQELWNSCSKLGISDANITLIDNHHLKDNPKVLWEPDHISKILLQHVKALDIDTLITFDDYGVSGHLNHISIYNCVQELVNKWKIPQNCKVFVLESVCLFRKYFMGDLDAYLAPAISGSSLVMYATNEADRRIIRCAMAEHTSQCVWYRKLFVIFSRYVHVNTFKELARPIDAYQDNRIVDTSGWAGYSAFKKHQAVRAKQQQ